GLVPAGGVVGSAGDVGGGAAAVGRGVGPVDQGAPAHFVVLVGGGAPAGVGLGKQVTGGGAGGVGGGAGARIDAGGQAVERVVGVFLPADKAGGGETDNIGGDGGGRGAALLPAGGADEAAVLVVVAGEGLVGMGGGFSPLAGGGDDGAHPQGTAALALGVKGGMAGAAT